MLPPTTLRLNAVPRYMAEKYKYPVTERTVRNWVKIGLGNDQLETRQVRNPQPSLKCPMMMVTTSQWVDEFVSRTCLPVTREVQQ